MKTITQLRREIRELRDLKNFESQAYKKEQIQERINSKEIEIMEIQYN